MLRTDLIDVINSGNAWAFIGSGVSADAGLPAWKGLFEGVLESVGNESARTDPAMQRHVSERRYASAFGRLTTILGREVVVAEVGRRLQRGVPGRLVRSLADWPFAGYVTTNYDSLIETALRERNESVWLPVGNTDAEVRKVSGDARRLVWHVHGALALMPEKSDLVLTEKDYDHIYLNGSPLLTQMRALLAQRRVVFFGFGFSDPEVLRLLKVVGLMCSPAAPAYAFVSGAPDESADVNRLEFLEQYNVDIIPYEIRGGSHKQLEDILQVYESFVLRRSLRFGHERRPLPSYDPETTGLLVYNRLTLGTGSVLPQNALASLLKARVLALLQFEGEMTASDIADRLAERIRLVAGTAAAEERALATERISDSLRQLEAEGLLSLADERRVSLTSAGCRLLEEQAALAVRMGDQFRQSLLDRAAIEMSDATAAGRVGEAAEAFFKDSVSRRGLGVAMAWLADRKDVGEYHAIGLLQTLPSFMKQVATNDEALALTKVVRSVLARPNDFEREYLGAVLQAHFGVALLGFDQATLQVRAREFENTLFLIDSSTLIPALGRSSTGHAQAGLLLRQLSEVKSSVATTPLLVEEVAEHARWALRHVGAGNNSLTAEALAAASGRAGARSNVFLEGFLVEIGARASSPSLSAYLASVCGDARAGDGLGAAFQSAVSRMGVAVRPLQDWDGFEELVWAEREDAEAKIEARRREKNTFTHHRQVKAEAEALLIVEKVRNGAFRATRGETYRDAYFISNTRVIDRVSESKRPITMRPELVSQWLTTISPIGVAELGALTDGLLWELAEKGFSIVDQERLRVAFSPLIAASRELLDEEVLKHRELVSLRYGESPATAFGVVNDLDVPLVLRSTSIQRARVLEELLERERAQKDAAEGRARISEKEKADAAAYRELKKAKKRKSAAVKRAAASKSGRRRKRKGR